MKISTKKMSYEKVLERKRPEHRSPKRPSSLLRGIIRLIGSFDLRAVRFKYTRTRMKEMGKGPWLVVMNHSSFIDLEIAHKVIPGKFCIVCTSDGLVGKERLMRSIGCIPTQKFVTDPMLISDMRYALNKLSTSVLLYPEASYSFDGCATPLPRRMGILLKRLNVPVVSIITKGAFARDPLYNGLQKRKVKVTAEVRGLLTAEEIGEKSVQELDDILDEVFSFDNFAWQRDNGIEIKEKFRADGLNRILYKCAACGVEGRMEGKGTTLTCRACGKQYELNTLGQLEAHSGETEFPHIPDWYTWERAQVRQELENGSYLLDTPVDIGMMVDYKHIYMVGEGNLRHDLDGFHLTGCGGKLDYRQKPQSCYGLYSDYYWYEIGDVICIGNGDALYYCFPKGCSDVVARTRLAAEELYKLVRAKKREKSASAE
ncbi:MAG: hypothetical protein E7554_02180 [Ruminococcaceae bacterium]|nr:hypothetical protein [Oscillospiraceae bacterium]